MVDHNSSVINSIQIIINETLTEIQGLWLIIPLKSFATEYIIDCANPSKPIIFIYVPITGKRKGGQKEVSSKGNVYKNKFDFSFFNFFIQLNKSNRLAPMYCVFDQTKTTLKDLEMGYMWTKNEEKCFPSKGSE